MLRTIRASIEAQREKRVHFLKAVRRRANADEVLYTLALVNRFSSLSPDALDAFRGAIAGAVLDAHEARRDLDARTLEAIQ
jgi:hypothetical protein